MADADATIRVRLDASDLTAGARRAGTALESLMSRGMATAAGMRGAAADMTRFASATDQVSRTSRAAFTGGAGFTRRNVVGSDALRAAGFTGAMAPGFSPRASQALRGAGMTGAGFTGAVQPGFTPRDRGAAIPPDAGAGVTRGPGFTMTDADRGMRTPGRARPGEVAGLGFTASRPFGPMEESAARAEARMRSMGQAGTRAARQTAGATNDASAAMRRFGTAGQRAGAEAARGMDTAARAADRASRHAQIARQPQGATEGGIAGDGGQTAVGRLWSLQAAGTQVRMLSRAINQLAGTTVETGAGRQTARAEMRTVVMEGVERAMVRDAAREAARDRGGMAVPVSETDFTNAVFGGVASGLTAQRAVNLVPAASNLALAGQTTPQQAQIGLTQLSKFYPERSFTDLADAMAKAQDLFAFPGGITQLTEGFRGAGAAAQQIRMRLEDQLMVQGVFADVGRRGAQGGTATRIFTASLAQGFERLGMQLHRRDDGTLDVPANLRAVRALNLSMNDMNRIFTRRGATAITQQLSGIEKLERGLGDYADTALENAMEHLRAADGTRLYESSMQRLRARTELLTAEFGEGAIAARIFGADLATAGIDLALFLGDRFPKLLENAGKALQVGGAVTGVAGGILETSVGVYALSQLLGLQTPLARLVPLFTRLATASAGMVGPFVAIAAVGTHLALTGRRAEQKRDAVIAERGAMEHRLGREVGPGEFALRSTIPSLLGIQPPLIGHRPENPVDRALGTGIPAGPVQDAGAAIPQSLGDGMEAGAEGLGRRLGDMLRAVFWPRMPSSDAETGPLANLTAWGRAIPATLADGIRQGQGDVAAALTTALTPPAPQGNAAAGADTGALLQALITALRENTMELRRQAPQDADAERDTDTVPEPPPWVMDYRAIVGEADAL